MRIEIILIVAFSAAVCIHARADAAVEEQDAILKAMLTPVTTYVVKTSSTTPADPPKPATTIPNTNGLVTSKPIIKPLDLETPKIEPVLPNGFPHETQDDSVPGNSNVPPKAIDSNHVIPSLVIDSAPAAAVDKIVSKYGPKAAQPKGKKVSSSEVTAEEAVEQIRKQLPTQVQENDEIDLGEIVKKMKKSSGHKKLKARLSAIESHLGQIDGDVTKLSSKKIITSIIKSVLKHQEAKQALIDSKKSARQIIEKSKRKVQKIAKKKKQLKKMTKKAAQKAAHIIKLTIGNKINRMNAAENATVQTTVASVTKAMEELKKKSTAKMATMKKALKDSAAALAEVQKKELEQEKKVADLKRDIHLKMQLFHNGLASSSTAIKHITDSLRKMYPKDTHFSKAAQHAAKIDQQLAKKSKKAAKKAKKQAKKALKDNAHPALAAELNRVAKAFEEVAAKAKKLAKIDKKISKLAQLSTDKAKAEVKSLSQQRVQIKKLVDELTAKANALKKTANADQKRVKKQESAEKSEEKRAADIKKSVESSRFRELQSILQRAKTAAAASEEPEPKVHMPTKAEKSLIASVKPKVTLFDITPKAATKQDSGMPTEEQALNGQLPVDSTFQI